MRSTRRPHTSTRRKRFGQHFLADTRLAQRIVDAAGIQPDDLVLEVGPGRGVLTERLLERAGHVIAIELDDRLIPSLKARFPSERLELIHDDVLRVDLSALAARSLGQKLRVVANLPYSISTAVLQHFVAHRAHIRDATVLLQKEVVDRIVAQPGTKEYGGFTVWLRYYAEARKLFGIAPGAFRPPPKVQSLLLHLLFRADPPVRVTDEPMLFRIIEQGFAQRRKKLANNLRPLFDAERILSTVRRLGIPEDVRAEALDLETFARLSDELSS